MVSANDANIKNAVYHHMDPYSLICIQKRIAQPTL